MKEYRKALLVPFPSPHSLIHSPIFANTMIRSPTKARRDWIAAACFESSIASNQTTKPSLQPLLPSLLFFPPLLFAFFFPSFGHS